jgi:hypothetical protein
MWCKSRAIEMWREHVRKWKVLKRVLKVKQRKTKEMAMRKWVKWAQGEKRDSELVEEREYR